MDLSLDCLAFLSEPMHFLLSQQILIINKMPEHRHEDTKSNHVHRPIVDRPACQARITIIARKAIEKMVRDLDW
jgi:hypothetical protein